MRFQLIFSAFILIIVTISNSCNKVPVYPDAPQIEFADMQKYAGGDSVIITLNFKDGDGDLGLRNEDIHYPYHKFDIIKDGSGNIIKYSGSPSYNCNDYDIGHYDSDNIIDTILIEKNPNNNNYFIDFLVKQPDDTYVQYDFAPLCFSFNGRFPLLNPLSNKGPIEGALSYTLKTLRSGFLNQTIKFRIHIQDRALNKSNVVETQDVVIN
jgi:hypothetical protein